jgi:N-acetylmuramoyl-L-alanine amidase
VEPTSSSPQTTHRPKGLFFYTWPILLVALVVATLFTAFSDPSLLPAGFSDQFSISLAQRATPTPPDQPTPTPRTNPLIGIVAGHSGNDSGAVCADGVTEASVNEKVAAFVKEQLVAQGYDVDILQEFDPRLTGYKATILLSIHADSCDYINDLATGFKVSSALANPHPERAARLTACLRNRYGQVTGLPLHTSVTVDMTSYHAFAEINPDTTAAIIEVGFLNLDKELLTKQPELLAQGIVSGVSCYMNNEEINGAP